MIALYFKEINAILRGADIQQIGNICVIHGAPKSNKILHGNDSHQRVTNYCNRQNLLPSYNVQLVQLCPRDTKKDRLKMVNMRIVTLFGKTDFGTYSK